MNPNADHKSYQYDAFISYSRKDAAFARRLEADLERYRAPRNAFPNKRRLNIFRDVQDLIGNELSGAIKDALRQSEFLIVVCSPDSRQSEWVAKEIDEFMQTHAKEMIIPVLASGRPNHEVGPDEEQNQAFPEALFDYLEEPLAADFRTVQSAGIQGARNKKREARFQILAQLLKTAKEDLLRRQRQRTIWMLAVAAGVFFGLSVAFAWIAILAIQNAGEAKRQLNISRSRELGAYAVEENTRGNSNLAVLLAIEASRIAETMTAYKMVAHFAGPFRRFKGHGKRIKHLAWSPDDTHLLSVSHDGSVRIWNTDNASGKSAFIVKADNGKKNYHAAWNAEGSRLVTAGADGTARIWDPAGGRQLLTIRAHRGAVNYAAWNATGSQLVTAGDDGIVRTWDAATGKPLLEFKGHTSKVVYASWNKKAHRIVSLGMRTARVWDSKTAGPHLVHKFGLSSGYAEWNAAGTRLLTSLDNGQMKIWNAEDDTVLEFQDSHYEDQPTDVAWNPDGNRLLTVSYDQTARIWDTRTGEQLMRLSYSEATPIRRAAWNESGTRFATAGDDRAARVWDAATGTQIQAFEGYPRDVEQLTWNSRANRLATASGRQVVIQYTDIEELLQAACKKVKKNMYPIDWQRFFPGEAYRRTCPELPSPE